MSTSEVDEEAIWSRRSEERAMTEEELRFLRTLPEIEKDKRRDKGMSSLQQVLDVVDDLARHLLKEYPRIDIEDETAVTELCLDLGVDLRPKSGGQFAWADLVRAVHWNRHLQAFGGGAC